MIELQLQFENLYVRHILVRALPINVVNSLYPLISDPSSMFGRKKNSMPQVEE